MSVTINEELFSFLDKSYSTFHAIAEMKVILLQEGFVELFERNSYKLEKGEKYFVVRNESSLIAFTIGKDMDEIHYQIAASHSDSPSYKVKENAELKGKGSYIQLNTEGYGGMLASTWLDRPLSLAGRVLVKENGKLESKLLNIDKNLLVIPNVAIHINRDANTNMSYNQQVDMLPLFGQGESDYYQVVAKALGVKRKDIKATDLYLYSRMKASFWGENNEYIASQRLDNLECAFTSLKGFINSENENVINVYACFDNEEVGSQTKQGAGSTFLYDTLRRINYSLGNDEDDYYASIAKSFMLSCDNAHALHPNHPEKADALNYPMMNQGVVIKFNANQKYTTDAVSAGVFIDICDECEVPYQYYTNRSDMPGGSTLGNISSAKVSLNSVDIGLAQLAMHSSYESAGSKDSEYMYTVLKTFFDANIIIEGNNTIKVVYK